MSDQDRLTLWVGVLTAAVTLVAALAGVLVTVAIERRRSQLVALQDVRRQLWHLPFTVTAELDDVRAGRTLKAEVERLLHEIDIRIPELPSRVRRVVQLVVDIVRERATLGEAAARTATWVGNDLLREQALRKQGIRSLLLDPLVKVPIPRILRRYETRLLEVRLARAQEVEREIELERQEIERQLQLEIGDGEYEQEGSHKWWPFGPTAR